MKFRKKPVVIEAVQWFKHGDHPAVFIFQGESQVWVHGQAYIETLEGRHLVRPGDWIITGVRGEHYPCRDDIFRKTYEPADALAQPEHEPVAWMNPRNNAVIDAVKKKQIGEGDGYPRFSVPLYAQPVDEIAKRGHEPVAWITRRTGDGGAYVDGYECCEPTDYGAFPVYHAPPKREWVGLTDEEILDAADSFGSFQYGDAQGHKRLEFAKAIEAKAKEKNT